VEGQIAKPGRFEEEWRALPGSAQGSPAPVSSTRRRSRAPPEGTGGGTRRQGHSRIEVRFDAVGLGACSGNRFVQNPTSPGITVPRGMNTEEVGWGGDMFRNRGGVMAPNRTALGWARFNSQVGQGTARGGAPMADTTSARNIFQRRARRGGRRADRFRRSCLGEPEGRRGMSPQSGWQFGDGRGPG